MRQATVFCYGDVQYEYGSRPQLYLILTKDAARYSGCNGAAEAFSGFSDFGTLAAHQSDATHAPRHARRVKPAMEQPKQQKRRRER